MNELAQLITALVLTMFVTALLQAADTAMDDDNPLERKR